MLSQTISSSIKAPCRRLHFGRAMLIALILLLPPSWSMAVDISDIPLENKFRSAAPNIMFVYDNSGSMDWEFITTNSNGIFDGGIEYLFDDPGDNNYNDSNGDILSGPARGQFKSQWSGYNKIFYNPESLYLPWVGKAEFTDPTAVPSNPHYPTVNPFDLTAEYHSIIDTTGSVVVDDIEANADFMASGNWGISTNSAKAYLGDDYHWNSSSTNGSYVRWTPTLPSAGDYQIWAYTNDNGNRTTVSYVVNHDGGSTTTFTHDQDQTHGLYYLGTVYFDAGGSEYVQLTANSGNSSTHMADAMFFVPDGNPQISIKRAHYYTWYDADADKAVDNGEIYLVNFVSGVRQYYRFTDSDNDDVVDPGELGSILTGAAIPDAIKPDLIDEDGTNLGKKTDAEDLQNFMNWYSYYRRRELTAKAAVSHALADIRRAYIGIYTINSGVRKEVQPVQVESNAVVVDDLNYNTAKVSGTWADHDDGAAFEGHQYRASVNGTFRWNPYVSATKDYDIYARWKLYSTRDTKALYTVYYDSDGDGDVDGADTPFTKELDQTKSTATWTEAETNGYLGTFRFPAGESGYVTVSRHSGSTNTYTCADAIRLVPVTGSVEVDATDQLLEDLYSIDSDGSTPLRVAFNEVGKYFDTAQSSSIGTSPILSAAEGGECQRNYAIVMTDGYYNGSFTLANQDGGQGEPFEDTYENTLADIAMYYYKTDLSSTLNNLVGQGSEGCDQALHQHMVTYSVSFGVTGTIDPLDIDGDGNADSPTYEDNRCFSDANAPKPTWPNPGSGASQKIDDLFHAAVNGRGLFFSATNPEELVESLVKVVEGLNKDDASGASVAINGLEGGTVDRLFQTSYKPNWTGDLKAFGISSVTGQPITGEGNEVWSAKAILSGVDWNSGRRIATSGETPNSGVVFSTAGIGGTLSAKIHADSATANSIVEFVRGKPVTGFRTREGLLGDLIHSAPVYHEDTDSVYVGGNDGMLHVFNASNGTERFAFVPNLILDKLHELTNVDYEHKYFVDATPTIAELGTNTTLLVSGLAKGGKGYFALNVHDAAAVTAESDVATMFEWQFPQSGDDDMGYSYSHATVAKTSGGTDAVIFGNGYNSVNGHAVLFVLDASDGSLLARIDTGVGGDNGLSTPTVVDVNNDFIIDFAYAGDLKGNLWKFDLSDATPSNWGVAFANDSNVPQPLFRSGRPITTKPDVMYHCDQFGFMVIFGTGQYLGDSDATNTDVQSVYGIWDYSMNEDKGEYLGSFTRPATVGDPGSLSNQPTGVTLLMQEAIDHQADINSTIWRTLSANQAIWTTDTDTMNDQDGTALGFGVTQYANPAVDTAGGETEAHVGWYFDLPAPGERVIVDLRIWDSKAIVLSFIPSDSLCEGGGSSFFHELNACTGGRLDTPALDYNGDGIIDDQDKVTITGIPDPVPPTGPGWPDLVMPPVIIQTPNPNLQLKVGGASGAGVNTIGEIPPRTGRFYWDER